jgi:hypothetical protein
MGRVPDRVGILQSHMVLGTQQGLRGGKSEPSRGEQQLCGLIGWGLAGLDILLVHYGMEKPFTI